MSIDITSKMAAVAEEFGMSKYLSKAERDAAVIQELVRVREELEAAQAREKALREALIHCSTDEGPEQAWVNAAREALALPTDDTALRQAIRAAKEEMRERCARVCERSVYYIVQSSAASIRALEVE